MTNLEKAKRIIKENHDEARCGIYNCRNLVGDSMATIYEDEELTIDICRTWSYFEVFGLTDKEFAELKKYYYTLD